MSRSERLAIAGRYAGAAVWPLLQRAPGPVGQVLSVYKHSLLWLASEDWPLTLSVSPSHLGPVVLLADGTPADLVGVRSGDPVIYAHETLYFGSGLAVPTGQVLPWSQPLPHLPVERVPSLVTALQAGTQEGKLGLTAPASVTALTTSLRAGAPAAVGEAVRGLIGLGPGLTPSGDDFLAGMMASLQALQHEGPVARAAALLRAAILQHMHQTTLVSRQLLRWAAQGAYGEPVRLLLAEAASGGPNLVERIHGLLAMGSTSGADTAAGILHGLQLGWELAAPLPDRFA